MAIEDLFGTWTLLTHRFVATASGEFKEMFGPAPQGCLIITPDQRMMALITADGRKPAEGDAGEAALFKSMLSYAGPFRIEGDQFITKVEVAWQPGWVGSEQSRTFEVQNGILSLKTPITQHPLFPGQMACGILTWQKAV